MGNGQVKYLFDTHAWIWWNMNPKMLSKKVHAVVRDTSGYDELLLSAISPWEFSKLLEKGRLAISRDPEEWLREAINIPRLRIVPLTTVIAYKSTTLPQPFFHDDPADQIIVATAREENATILTRDGRIKKYRHVKTLW